MKTLPYLASAGLLFASISPRVAGQQFTNVTASVGFVQEKQKSWGNPIWGDINNDGYLDLIVPTHGLLAAGGPFVYLNHGGQSFSDIRSTCGIKHGPPGSHDDGDWHGYAFGDYDQDGNLDLYVAEGAKANQGGTNKHDNLFRGHGDGTFEYTSIDAGLEISMNRGRGAFWVDYDNDGRPDLFVKNYAGLNVLYHNDGNGSLTIVPDAGGLVKATLGKGDGSIISFADYDNDGFMDVAITGDADTQALYHNQGDGTFIDVTATSGITPEPNGKGISWGDYNNDGFLDLFIARGQQGSLVEGASLYRNNGDGTFTDVTTSAGVAILATCWTGAWGDYDNDGRLDLFVTSSGDTGDGQNDANLLYHNNGDGTFTNVASNAGVAMADGAALHKGAAWGDYNNDGFLDLVVKDGVGNESDNGTGAKGLHFLFKNNGNANRYIKLDLKGVQSNLHGIGAAVTVTSTNGMSYRQNDGGGGGENDSQGSEPLHFGLGAATEATIAVRWPSGAADTLTHVAANSSLVLVEGSITQSPPLIIQQPRDRHVPADHRAKFSVKATGDGPLSYQWRKNGDEIGGATRSQYTTPPTTLADDGSLFSVVVSNSVGSVTSRNARLSVTSTY